MGIPPATEASNSKFTLFFSASFAKRSPCFAIKALLGVMTCILFLRAVSTIFFEIPSDCPIDSNKIYVYGVPILKSNDSGKSYERIGASNVHVDHHDLWINPENTDHLVLGNDGGVNISYDEGANWIKLNQPSVGQFYSINVDNSEPYNVYGGLQDNGVWMAKNNSVESPSWYESGHNNWTKIMGGDGMQIQIDNRDNNIVYLSLIHI